MDHEPSRTEQHDWETWYEDEAVESMPWFLRELDQDFDQSLKELQINGQRRALDLGSGPGTQAIQLADRGFRVTGVDISPTAVRKASERARREGKKVEFLQDDILHTRLNGRRFEVVVDRGCYHTLPLESRPVYVKTVSALLEEQGVLLLKCFSHLQPGTDGPYRLTPDEVREQFGKDFEVLSLRDSIFLGNHKPPPKALYAILRKRQR